MIIVKLAIVVSVLTYIYFLLRCLYRHDHPVTLKINHLTYTHFERVDTSYDSRPRYHDYRFQVDVTIDVRRRVHFYADYFELPMADGDALKIDCEVPTISFDDVEAPFYRTKELAPGSRAEIYHFRFKSAKEIIVPQHGYVVFNWGKREKVKIILEREEYLAND